MQPGAMMAVGTSAEDASEVLEAGPFKGRVTIAAINSSSSVTLSGDVDAIEELRDIFEDEGKCVWVLSVTGRTLSTKDEEKLKAEYWYFGSLVAAALAPGHFDAPLRTFAIGSIIVTLGDPSPTLLPSRSHAPDNTLLVKIEDFYDSLSRMGYGYSGPFYALSGLSRRLGAVRGQAVLLAQAAPYDGTLWSLYVLKTIKRITVNPALCQLDLTRELFKDNVDVRLLKRIGENLISIADEKITAIEIAMEDYLLNEVYVASLGLKEVIYVLARVRRSGAIFRAFPDWWLGTSEGRILGPLVSIAEWDKTLRDTGFSGVDTYSPTSHQFSHPTAVFVTQAVDNQVSYIQDPLSQPLPQAIQIAQDELVIIRGKGQQTRDLVAELVPILQQRFEGLKTFKSFAELANTRTKLSSSSLILSLTELNQPLLQTLSSAEFKGIKAALLSLGSIF
ncbi:hypothetical protein J3E72DRAFT_273825 [Bipolaris maydis]|nr:hypothetical protein J3E72DRAFT_273825 [Bipolaris maydis]